MLLPHDCVFTMFYRCYGSIKYIYQIFYRDIFKYIEEQNPPWLLFLTFSNLSHYIVPSRPRHHSIEHCNNVSTVPWPGLLLVRCPVTGWGQARLGSCVFVMLHCSSVEWSPVLKCCETCIVNSLSLIYSLTFTSETSMIFKIVNIFVECMQCSTLHVVVI